MARTLLIRMPQNFSFRHTIQSHGWYDLPPFEIDETNSRLSYVFSPPIAQEPFRATISNEAGMLKVEYSGAKADKKELEKAVKHILRLDDDLSAFYGIVEKAAGLAWVRQAKAGRLLRSPTVFEDL